MKRILLWMIRFYRKYLSKMKRYNTCKYYPTCSQYALEAIEKYGALKGGVLLQAMETGLLSSRLPGCWVR